MLFYTLILTSCTSSNQVELTELETHEKFNEKTIEINILNSINDYRVSNGFSPLEKLQAIKTQTNNHTNYMINEAKVSHDYFYDRKKYLKENANAISVSENIAYGYSSAETVLNAWLKSNSHKKNIEGNFTHFDITAEKDFNGKWYFTNIFVKK
ncbi:CAP domain-containing protein [Tenacibaculum aestuariivivum]|uniref:CAP domain-containing protein n=1 Tax=Tenacibaculum aestuariivivum TaxID=2006131 RepID=UPI003AB7A7F5